jgi:hypothetical protein
LKSNTLFTVPLLVAIAALTANTYWLRSDLTKIGLQNGWNQRKIALLQVQLMDRVLVRQEGQELDKLINNPVEWLAPLQEMINKDPKLAALLKEVGLKPSNLNGAEAIDIYCNPVDDNPEPYEVFTLQFSGDRCVEITRRALRPW